MNETCDRCGPAVHAAYRVARSGGAYRVDRSGVAYRVARSGELYLCGHCTNFQRPALSAQGWNIRLIREQLAAVSAA
jgi:hypothetical protein